MTAASQIAGFTSANIAEVESATKALRVTLRPEDYGALGIYSAGGSSGLMAASLAAGSTIFSFRWGNASNLALVKRVVLSAGNDATAFAAGSFIFNLFRALSFSASDSGGTSILPSGNQNKLRTAGMGTTLVTDTRISSTAALTPGTRTVDAQPVGSFIGGIVAVAGSQMLAPNSLLFDQRPGEHPLVLAQNEGLIIQATVPITGTWKFGVKIDWTEIATY